MISQMKYKESDSSMNIVSKDIMQLNNKNHVFMLISHKPIREVPNQIEDEEILQQSFSNQLKLDHLYIYKNSQDKLENCKQCYPIRQIKRIGTLSAQGKDRFSFYIEFKDKTINLSAYYCFEMDLWLSCLKQSKINVEETGRSLLPEQKIYVGPLVQSFRLLSEKQFKQNLKLEILHQIKREVGTPQQI